MDASAEIAGVKTTSALATDVMLETTPQTLLETGIEADLTGGTYSSWDDVPPRYQPDPDDGAVDTTKVASQSPPTTRPAEAYEEPVEKVKATAPYRQLRIGEATIDVDYDVWVRGGENGSRTAKIRLWNIESDTWAQIIHGVPIEVEVGWRETESTTIFSGFARHKRRLDRTEDHAFVINAAADSHAHLSSGVSGSWNQTPPHRIAEYLAEKIGLETRYISHTSDPIPSWTVTKRRDLKAWLNKLAKTAGENASSPAHSDPWVWYIDDGELSFHSRSSQTETPVRLETGASLLRAAPTTTSDGSDRIGYSEVSFDCRCEPWIHRGSVVQFLGTGLSENTLYRVKSIEFETSTTTGRHHVHGTAVPVRDVRDRDIREQGRLPPQRAEKDRIFRDTTPTRN